MLGLGTPCEPTLRKGRHAHESDQQTKQTQLPHPKLGKDQSPTLGAHAHGFWVGMGGRRLLLMGVVWVWVQIRRKCWALERTSCYGLSSLIGSQFFKKDDVGRNHQ